MSFTVYIASFLLIFWGMAHLFATRNVVKGFGELSPDNHNIILMEWVIEGLTLIFLGILALLMLWFVGLKTSAGMIVIHSIVGMLMVLAIWALFTGNRIAFLPFKLCFPIFMTASVLLLLAVYF